MFYAPKHFYNDDQPRGYLPWHQKQKEIAAAKAQRDIILLNSTERAERTFTVLQVQRAAYKAFAVKADELHGDHRQRVYMDMRFAAIWCCRKYTPASLKRIGRMFNRDHSTVIHALKKVQADYGRYMADIEAIEAVLFAGQPGSSQG